MSSARPAGLDLALAKISQIALDKADLTAGLRASVAAATMLADQIDGAAIGWVESGRSPAFSATTDTFEQLERMQHALGEGPSLDALQTGQVCRGGDTTWKRFGPRIGRAGIHSIASVPLAVGMDLAWLSVYAGERDALDDPLLDQLQHFSEVVSIHFRNAQLLIHATREAELAARQSADGAVIERAVGILMSRRGIDPAEALGRLREMSQRSNVRLVVAAQSLVDEAVKRAKARPDPLR